MREFIQFKKFFVFVALGAFLGFMTVSCDKSDDDDSSGSRGSVFKFKDGLDSDNKTTKDGDEQVTLHGSSTSDQPGVSTNALPAC